MFIRDLPYTEMKQLCVILDENNRFEELGQKHMQFDSGTMQSVRQKLSFGGSPSRELLDLWDYHNHTVVELFILLSRMKLYHAMVLIRKFVDDKYHFLIKSPKVPTKPDVVSKKIAVDLQQCLNISETNKLQNHINNNNHNNNIDRQQEQLTRDDNFVESSPPQNFLKPPRSPFLGQSKAAVSSVLSQYMSAIPQISYEELMKATNNWDSNTILGRGGFGIVFKGTWKCTKVAIKRIEQKEGNPDAHNEQIKQSLTELQYLNAYRHDNILPLYGCSFGGPHPCLVYQFMSGSSLERRLRPLHEPVLNWEKRLNIAIGTARGLQFLHTIGDKPLIHGDIKPANILLDPNDSPRIGDFGLAREGPQSSYIKLTSIAGTRPYLPDEFLILKKFSTKVDTYSFGIVLFEIATGLQAYSPKRERRFLKDYIVEYKEDVMNLKDQRAPVDGNTIFKSLLKIGKDCVNTKAADRPAMRTVLIHLEAVE